MSIVLTDEELKHVTGYTQPKAQAQYIRDHYGCPAHVNAANECIVIRAHLEAAQRPPEHNRPSVRSVRKRA